jgi:hypothetical protein
MGIKLWRAYGPAAKWSTANQELGTFPVDSRGEKTLVSSLGNKTRINIHLVVTDLPPILGESEFQRKSVQYHSRVPVPFEDNDIPPAAGQLLVKRFP